MLGSGIFLVPSSVLNQSGGALGIALIVWVAAGILSVLGALTYGELGAMKPEAGGIYIYIRDAFGPFLAFLYGWALFFVIGSGSVATLTVAFTAYLQEFVDARSDRLEDRRGRGDRDYRRHQRPRHAHQRERPERDDHDQGGRDRGAQPRARRHRQRPEPDQRPVVAGRRPT